MSQTYKEFFLMKLHQEHSMVTFGPCAELKDSGLHYEVITFNYEPF